MKRSGRVNWMVLIVLVFAVFIGAFLFGAKGDPAKVANDFLIALSKGDDEQLMKLSYYANPDKSVLRKQWEFATKEAGPHYTFYWKIKDAKITDANSAAVQLDFVKNAMKPGAFPDAYELPMVKVDGDWKVDVAAINRDIYPALPR